MVNRSTAFVCVPFDAGGRALPEMAVEPAPTLDEAFARTRDRLPRDARGFVLFERDGGFVRAALLPTEPLTDDPDVTSMALDATGRWLASGHADGNLRLWDLESGDPVWTRAPADEPIVGLRFVEPGGYLLAWCDDGPLLIFTRENGELANRIEDPQEGSFVVTVSPAANEVAMTGPRVMRLALPSGERLPMLDADRNGGAMVRRDEDGTAVPADAGVQWLAYVPDASVMVGVRAGEPEDEVVFWDLDRGERLATLRGFREVAACDLSPDGRLAAVACAGDIVQLVLIDTVLRCERSRVDLPLAGVGDLRFVHDGSAVLAEDPVEGVVRVDVSTGQVSHLLRANPDDRARLRAEPLPEDRERDSTPMMVTHDLQGQLELTRLVPRGPFGPTGRALSTNGTRYGVIDESISDHEVTIVDPIEHRVLATLSHPADVREVWLSDDGTRIAARAGEHVYSWLLPQLHTLRPAADATSNDRAAQ